MFGLTVITAPAEEPVSLDEAKQQIGYAQDVHDQDDLIRGLIKAARIYCERVTGKAFITQTLKLTLDAFPRDGIIRLPRPPLVTLTASQDYPDLGITYDDTTGTEQTLVEGTDYVVDTECEPGRVGLVDGATWPCTINQLGAIRVTYVAGYGAKADVPESIKAAMKLLITHWFENRAASITGTIQTTTEIAVEALLGCESAGVLVGTYG